MWPGVGVKTLPPVRVAYIIKKGPYSALPAAFKELAFWIRERGLVITGSPVLVYLSNPGGMQPAQREWEIQIPVAGDAVPVSPEENPGVKDLPMREMVYSPNRGAYTAVESLLPALFQVLYDKGFRLAGPAEEVYPPDFAGIPVEKLRTEVRFPVAPR